MFATILCACGPMRGASQITVASTFTGANPLSAAFDLARTVCRRAERRVCALQEARQLHNPEIIVYLNRLSDLLWLLARRAEGRSRGVRE